MKTKVFILISLFLMLALIAAWYFWLTVRQTVCISNTSDHKIANISLTTEVGFDESFNIDSQSFKRVYISTHRDASLSLAYKKDGKVFSSLNKGYISKYGGSKHSFTIMPDLSINYSDGETACR